MNKQATVQPELPENPPSRTWMCWIPHRGAPNKRHPSHDEAVKEAKRLSAREHCDVFILCVSGVVSWPKNVAPIYRPTI